MNNYAWHVVRYSGAHSWRCGTLYQWRLTWYNDWLSVRSNLISIMVRGVTAYDLMLKAQCSIGVLQGGHQWRFHSYITVICIVVFTIQTEHDICSFVARLNSALMVQFTFKMSPSSTCGLCGVRSANKRKQLTTVGGCWKCFHAPLYKVWGAHKYSAKFLPQRCNHIWNLLSFIHQPILIQHRSKYKP